MIIIIYIKDGTKPGTAGSGEGVLANFFNSLLNKKTGTSPGSTSPATKSLGKTGYIYMFYRFLRLN